MKKLEKNFFFCVHAWLNPITGSVTALYLSNVMQALLVKSWDVKMHEGLKELWITDIDHL